MHAGPFLTVIRSFGKSQNQQLNSPTENVDAAEDNHDFKTENLPRQ
jgi:hypothetical protein